MELKHRITQLKQQLLGIMQDRHETLPDLNARLNDQCLMTLSEITRLLNDAQIQAEHPTVKRGPIGYFDSSEYIHTAVLGKASFLCGVEWDTSERVTPGLGVPDCPECLAILEAEAEKKMKQRGA